MSLFRVFLNEVSLNGIESREALRAAFQQLLEARRASPNLAQTFYCSRYTTGIQAVGNESLISSISTFPRDERTALLIWLTRNGPFLEDDRMEVAEDLYHFHDTDVTELGLGEAARQVQRGNDARLFSFTHRADIDFTQASLEITHGFSDAPLARVIVINIHEVSKLKAAAEAAVPEPKSWLELLNYCRRRYGRVMIGPHSEKVLRPQPFSPNVARRTIELLRVLDDLMAEVQDDGSFTSKGEAIKQMHFVGEKAWFTGESKENERLFGKDMIFPDPNDSSQQIQCFWHGKIKTPQFRVHFEWPIRSRTKIIKVTYIGPKISKK